MLLPGMTPKLVIPTLETASGKKYGQGFGVAVNPEFLREGTALKDFQKPPLTLVGHNHAMAATHVAAGDDAEAGDSDARDGVGKEIRTRLRRRRESGVPARGHGAQGLPEASADARRPQPRDGRDACCCRG